MNGAALEDRDKAEAAANASAAQQAGAETETETEAEDEDAEDDTAPTELPTAERAVLALGARPDRWSQVATREQRRGRVQVFMASAKMVKVEDGDLYDDDTDNCG